MNAHLFMCTTCKYYLGVGPDCAECAEARHGGPAFEQKFALRQEAWAKRVALVVGYGQPAVIGLVGCGKAKRTGTHRAADLYVGNLFTGALRYSYGVCNETYILSAKHGLLPPEREIASYDYSLFDLPLAARDRWGMSVVGSLLQLFPATARIDFILLAGAGYIKPIEHGAKYHSITDQWSFRDPLHGMNLFRRLAWFRDPRQAVRS